MGFFDKIFGMQQAPFEDTIKVDMHNHILFGLDDGAKVVEESLDLLQGMQELGRKKIVMTPHIMSDFYKNGPSTILPQLEFLRQKAAAHGLTIQLDAAAEYYLDETFIKNIESGEPMLTFGKNYLLFETAFMNEPPQLKSIIFAMKSNGYKPVFAHPERYLYMHSNFSKYESLFERDIFFQINIMSLAGYYSPEIKKVAEKLIDAKMVHFISSDCHNMRHMEALRAAVSTKYYKKALDLPLLNNTLL
ncbi:MAG TPA: CpsB/CapC family capsule biosynthesis tyrosine phosphatase [Cytophagales bacterium]|nr:CpsB/CapC family capsule biosynthesis tyrosine phosphatase [Cytophagales bacterium]